MTRKDKQSMKRRRAEASRLDNLESIADIGDFEEINEVMKEVKRASSASKQQLDPGTDDQDEYSTGDMSNAKSSALQRTVNTFSQKILNKGNRKQQSSDEDVDFESKPKKKRAAMLDDALDEDTMADQDDYDDHQRRPAPEKEYDENNLLEAFAMKKRQFLAQKKDHYQAEPKYGGYEEIIPEGEKRAATYEMITNRGLTPHRNKVNRNARVKKRLKYDKALIRRKGAVQAVRVGEASAYGGELTGIKANISRSRKF
jgi:U3 small nucleolar RNA-associated protein 3